MTAKAKADPTPALTPGALIAVRCTSTHCAMHGKDQVVPAGVNVSATVLLTGTLSCATCGMPVENVNG